MLGEAYEIADAIIVAVGERLDVKLVDDRVLVPGVVHRLLLYVDLRQNVHGAAYASQRNNRAGSRAGSMVSRTPPHSMAYRSPLTRSTIARTGLRSPSGPMVMSPKWNQKVRGRSPASAMAAATALSRSTDSLTKPMTS